MATSLAPSNTYPTHSIFSDPVSELRTVAGDLTIATQLNEDGRVIEIMFCEYGVFLHGDAGILLHIKDIDARHDDGISQVWSVLYLLGVTEETFRAIRSAARDETGDYEIVAEQTFRSTDSLSAKIERIACGSNRPHWTWRKM